MKIAINSRVLNERHGGPARCTYNLIKELAVLDRENEYIILLYDDYDFGFSLPENFCIKICRYRNKIFFDYLFLPYLSFRQKIDFFVFPKNTFSPLVRGKKLPVFHDLVYFENFNFREFKFLDNLHHKIMIPISGKLSFRNISVSDFTSLRMIDLLRLDGKKTRVIKNAVESCFRRIDDFESLERVKQKYQIESPFYFYSGSLSPRKNMLNVIKAFLKIHRQVDHKIYFTAGDSWRDSNVLNFIKENGMGDRIIRLGFLPDDELVAMYNLADCYLYPSLYEGFGLPILEAQACGCPVITSSVSSCPEIAGDAALIVDPRNIDDIASAMLKVVSDPSLRETLVEKGFANVKRFSWNRSARELLDVFSEANSEHS